MPDNKHIHRVQDDAAAISAQNALMRDYMAKAFELLGNRVPDTFLGRKTQEPFPQQEATD